jgi:site-specific recombinase XerD
VTDQEERSLSSETEAISNAVRFDEYEAMLDVAGSPRNHLLIKLLWATGGRVSEVIELKPSQVRRPDTISLLNEKQHKIKPGEHRPREHKTIYVPESVVEDVLDFVAANKIQREGWVFQGRSPDRHIDRTTAWLIVTTIARRAGVFRDRDTDQRGRRSTPCYVHLFRHGTAVEMLESGYSIGSIQRHLGHKSIQTTGIYAKMSDPARRLETTKLRV